MVIFCHCTLSFENLDTNCWLVILVSRKGLTFLCWNNSVSCDNFGHDTTNSLNTLGKRGNIEKEKALCSFRSFTRQDTTLNSCTIGDCFIRVDASGRFLSIEVVLE